MPALHFDPKHLDLVVFFSTEAPKSQQSKSLFYSVLSCQQSQGGWFQMGFGAGFQSHPGTCLTWPTVLSLTEGARSSYKTDPDEWRSNSLVVRLT